MNRPDERAFSEFDAAYWEDRYRSGVGAGKHDPSPSLITETARLRPGRALDAPCGVGGDALWLAAHGWHVTAADISATAVAQARQTVQAAGAAFAERIEWVQADLTVWEPAQQAFDLVTSHYVHLPGPQEALFQRLASWVAPGRTLLVVGHDGRHGHGHAHPEVARVRAEQVVAGPPKDQWDMVVAELRTHMMQRPDGGDPITLEDVVVRARRRTPSQP